MGFVALIRGGLFGLALGAGTLSAGHAGTYNLTVDPIRIDTGSFRKSGIGYNNSQTPTVLRLREGETVTINVTNNLSRTTSVHWHGLVLPFDQDGVPGISYQGIRPGQTFQYRFPIRQAGTYWFHSHSGFQEPDGAYGAIVITPKAGETIRADRDYVVQLSDAHPQRGRRIMRNLKLSADYYNRSRKTLGDLMDEIEDAGLRETLKTRTTWGRMRMSPADIEDVQGFVPLINGQSTIQNWTATFKPGEKVRLRLINSSAMTYLDVRIPGLKMTVVQADGNDVKPVTVDELRIAVAETYDVIVTPREARAYSLIAESMGRTALVRGTLAPRQDMAGPVPDLRPRKFLTMADMGGMMDMPMNGMAMPASGKTMAMPAQPKGMAASDGMGKPATTTMPMASKKTAGTTMPPKDPFYAPGSGLTPSAADGGKFLSYADLRARKPRYPDRKPDRVIVLELTGNMDRYMWSINGVKYEDAKPIVLKYGERVRFKFVNKTMMAHPMHLHGMWSILDTGKGKWNPVKHVISVAPSTTVYSETVVDAPGQWAFHCHLSYHADTGMFRKVVVKGGPA